jgi:ubiquinone/menaquinone biosynthesis C-methylase UbiE
MNAPHRDKTRLAYDVVAESYARALPDTRAEAALDLAVIDHFLELLPGRHVLDAGCGAGRMMTHIASRSSSVVFAGVDLSPAMVMQARARYPEARVLEGDLFALPFNDSLFDGVLAWYSIIHTPLEDLGEIFAEFHRVLRPNGVALVAYQSGTGVREMKHAYGHDISLTAFLHSTEHIAARLEQNGFEVIGRLDRSPCGSERHSQGFVIARRS